MRGKKIIGKCVYGKRRNFSTENINPNKAIEMCFRVQTLYIFHEKNSKKYAIVILLVQVGPPPFLTPHTTSNSVHLLH